MIKNIGNKKMKGFFKYSLAFALVSFAYTGHAEQTLQHVGENAQLFKHWYKVNGNYTLITSAPIFQEQDTDTFTKGYRVPTSTQVSGALSREIYDYGKKQSSNNVFEQVRESLKNNGYEELFVCEHDNCGDVGAWQLMLSEMIGGKESSQYYLSAKKHLSEDDTTEYFSCYVNEIDGQTRMLVDMVAPPQQQRFDVVVKTTDLTRTIEKDGRVVLDGVFFDTGSAILKPESSNALQAMSKLLNENSNTRFAIVGHTDNVGSLQFNLKLSSDRANAVKQALLDQYHVSAHQISSGGVGPYAPMTSNANDQGRSYNRRVELVKL
ncbi:MAG: hypothetical protein COW84_06440 [Gammaproteobacteria bacterium CG22_combo_CG10-13_8_21_14_all_40_8]|nr:MAG: hypothetical protein COW84_06440 [Gammaproteobacteria bacterium CG22_combo_CG10-13_8_21_14_all_40_8]